MAASIVQYLGTGRRKSSVARVFLRPGKGDITVNGRSFEYYFPTEAVAQHRAAAALATETADKFDVLILADGGGVSGQAGAAKLGIARALVEFNAELRGKLKKLGFPDARPRKHERKKYGRRARASGSSSPNGNAVSPAPSHANLALGRVRTSG